MTLAVLAAAAWADDGDIVATVNDRPITRERLIDVLMEARGVEVLQQLIILQAVKNETRRRDIRVTRADVETEFQMALDRIAANAGLTGEQATEQNKRDALQAVLEERGLSMAEFMVGMERNAHLRKLVETELHITEQTLREEFARTYGERVEVRHIQIDRRNAQALNETLDLLRRGTDFADVARRLSCNPQTAARGGLMDPFTFDNPEIPEALREMAFSLKPGEVSSPVLAGQFFHILRVERRIPPANVRFEDVRQEVERRLRQRVTPQAMARLAITLFKEARIRVLDSRLRARYREYLKEAELEKTLP